METVVTASSCGRVIVPELKSLSLITIVIQLPLVIQGHTVDPCGTEETFVKLQHQRNDIIGDTVEGRTCYLLMLHSWFHMSVHTWAFTIAVHVIIKLGWVEAGPMVMLVVGSCFNQPRYDLEER